MSTDAVPSPDQWTVRRVLEWTIGHLKKHGSDSPRLDAEVLLAHARGCSRIQLYTAYDEVLSEPIRQKMRDLVKRRTNAEPVAYLVGTKEFFSLPFEVNRHTLVPRPETELLVMEALRLLKPVPAPRILEIGVGSGCISAAIAVNHKGAQIVGVELNPDTRDVAQRNLERHKVADRVDLRCGDIFAPLTEGEKFDLLISNPPYVRTAEISQLDPTVREHEPLGALDGGADGLDCIRRIAARAREFLCPDGWILLEFSPEQAESVRQILTENRFTDVTVLNDLGQVARAACARRGE